MLAEQGGRCLLCCDHIADDAVLDHDHKTGRVRGVLHRGCNAMLGHIENNTARNNLHGGRLFSMLSRVEDYLSRRYDSNPLHHTHRTEEEKRVRRNKKARATRAAKRPA
jgi:hypothetical protein